MAKDMPTTPEENTTIPAIPANDNLEAEQTPTIVDNVVPLNEVSEQAAKEEQEKAPEAPASEEKTAPAKKVRGGKARKTDKPEQEASDEKDSEAGKETEVPTQEEVEAGEQPQEPREAPRPDEQEQIVFLQLSELYPFKDHPFQVRDDDEMQAMVASVKDKGITTPAIVRPREDGGFEMVSGHRRQKASELAGYTDMPCIVRNLTDEQAITQMVEDNTSQRESILPSERAKALKMQLDAIKRQGARDGNGNGQRSNEIVAERNKMTVKQVQRYIKLTELVPDLMKYVDQKINKIQIAFTPAVELAFIKPKNQRYIAVAIEGNQSSPSLSQAQRMRELDQQKVLNPDVIDGILTEQKKEVDKVILSTQELSQYFGKEKTPREMKDTIMNLLDEWKGQQKEIAQPEKKPTEHEK